MMLRHGAAGDGALLLGGKTRRLSKWTVRAGKKFGINYTDWQFGMRPPQGVWFIKAKANTRANASDNEEKPCRVSLSKVVADRLDWPLHGSSSLLGLSVAGGIIGARAAW
jgi:hypothetical protein